MKQRTRLQRQIRIWKKDLSDHPLRSFSQGYQDSNLEMTESESVALPFGDSPRCCALTL